MLPIVANRSLPRSVGEVCGFIVRRIELLIQFRSEIAHDSIGPLFDWVFHKKCVLPAAGDQAGNAATRGRPRLHGEGNAWHCRWRSVRLSRPTCDWLPGPDRKPQCLDQPFFAPPLPPELVPRLS